MLFPEQVTNVLGRLEKEAQTYAVPEGSQGHEHVWTPDGLVRYWQVPSTTGELLYSLAKAKNATNILELGCSAGYSSIWLGLAVAENLGKVHTVDKARAKVDMARKNILEAGLETVVSIHYMDALEYLKVNQQPFDFVFLDADKLNYNRYFQYIDVFLKSGGMLVADNAIDYGQLMQDFLDALTENKHYRGATYSIDNGLAIYEKLVED